METLWNACAIMYGLFCAVHCILEHESADSLTIIVPIVLIDGVIKVQSA